MDFLILENVADRVSRNVRDYRCTLRDIQKSEYFSSYTDLSLASKVKAEICYLFLAFIVSNPGSAREAQSILIGRRLQQPTRFRLSGPGIWL